MHFSYRQTLNRSISARYITSRAKNQARLRRSEKMSFQMTTETLQQQLACIRHSGIPHGPRTGKPG